MLTVHSPSPWRQPLLSYLHVREEKGLKQRGCGQGAEGGWPGSEPQPCPLAPVEPVRACPELPPQGPTQPRELLCSWWHEQHGPMTGGGLLGPFCITSLQRLHKGKQSSPPQRRCRELLQAQRSGATESQGERGPEAAGPVPFPPITEDSASVPGEHEVETATEAPFRIVWTKWWREEAHGNETHHESPCAAWEPASSFPGTGPWQKREFHTLRTSSRF